MSNFWPKARGSSGIVLSLTQLLTGKIIWREALPRLVSGLNLITIGLSAADQ